MYGLDSILETKKESQKDRYPVLSNNVLNFAISQEYIDIQKKD